MSHLWEITNTDHTFVTEPGRGSIEGKRIHFKDMTGHQDYIDVPLHEFTPENVSAKVHERVMTNVAMHSLKGPEVPDEINALTVPGMDNAYT